MNYILTAEAARLLDLTPNGVRVMERRGEIHAERTPSGVRLFDRTVVQRVARTRANRTRQARGAEHASHASSY
jgi:DNA-binding transcriptional MerR regulator